MINFTHERIQLMDEKHNNTERPDKAERKRSKRRRAAGKPQPRRTPTVEISGSRCPQCNSTERTPYYATVRRPISGVDALGRRYTAIIWRRTKCVSCGQFRCDKTYECDGNSP